MSLVSSLIELKETVLRRLGRLNCKECGIRGSTHGHKYDRDVEAAIASIHAHASVAPDCYIEPTDYGTRYHGCGRAMTEDSGWHEVL
jgi:hypothetical protein